MSLSLSERRCAYKDTALTTLRAGYPLPDADWYRNTDEKTGHHVPMTFSKENFVQGFNITCGDYYILRDTLIPLLRKDDLYKKRFNNANVDYDYLWPIFDKLKAHTLLQHSAHVGWRHQMLFRWITVTAEWIKRLEKADGDVKNFPFLPQENWRWGRGDLSPKKRAPYTLYKHVSLRVVHEDESVAIVRVADLVDGSARPIMGNMVDIDLCNLRFTRLRQTLIENNFFGMLDTHEIQFLHPLAGNQYVAIEDDKQLAYAVQHLRIRGASKIDIQVVGTSEEHDADSEDGE